MSESKPTEEQNEPEKEQRGTLRLIMSLLAGAIGVQSNKNRERDFQEGDFKKFVMGGLIFTTLFIVILVAVARLAISG